ncbi:MAG: Nre family DNA repair protein [Candidatus Altiarchaeota archaeon]
MGKDLCLTCKGGRLLCGLSFCPLLEKIKYDKPVKERLSTRMHGPSPSVFVGWHGWPQVSVGPMTSIGEDDASVMDNPASWYGMGFDDIIRMRSQLIRSKQRVDVHSRGVFVEENQEIALSVKPVEVETVFKKKPAYSVSFSPVSQPMGPSGEIVKFDVTSNPSIPRKVDYVVNDELRAAEAASVLFEKNFDVYYLTTVLASGALGAKADKKMVPTRWSITAVDDILGKHLMERIRSYPSVNDYLVYSNTYLENHFEILVAPGGWEFEQFEVWAPKTLWTMNATEPQIAYEHEKHGGRWDYALNEGGGYYAGRFAVAEALDRMRRQARVIVFREIYEGYIIPVGVWEVRENARKAMTNPPKKFASMKEALTDVSTRLRIPMKKYTEKSEIMRQRRLTDFT